MLAATIVDHPWMREHSLAVFVRHDHRPQPLRIEAHDWFELVVVLRGAREHHWSRHVRELAPGDVTLSPSWEPHAWRSLKPDTLLVSVHFPPQFLGSEAFDGVPWLALFACDPPERPALRTPADRTEALELANHLARYRSRTVWRIAAGERLASERRREEIVATGYAMWPGEPDLPPGWVQCVRLHLLLLLLKLFQVWEHRDRIADSTRLTSTHLARVLPAIHLCSSQSPPLRRLSLGEAAEACHLSESRFRTLFRETTGVSFGTFELRRRLGRAVDLLLATGVPVETVAAESGFTDASHLRRDLLRHYHTTPAALRNAHPAIPYALAP
jgi:AraC-like DNA-binding protein